MNNDASAEAKIEPNLVPRADGGWPAISPFNAKIRIAVTGSTPDEALSKFSSVFNGWIMLLELDVPK